MILAHAKILSRSARSRNRISFYHDFVIASRVMLGRFRVLRTNSVLLSKGVYHEPDCYTENGSISCAARFNSDGSVWSAFHEFFHRNSHYLYFFAPLHSSPGGPVIGEVFGSKTLVKLATDANPNFEQRTTFLCFTFSDRQDQIIALGVADYSPTAGEFEADKPRARAILGGTGKYMGARGQLTSTRNADGSYTQVFTLLK